MTQEECGAVFDNFPASILFDVAELYSIFLFCRQSNAGASRWTHQSRVLVITGSL